MSYKLLIMNLPDMSLQEHHDSYRDDTTEYCDKAVKLFGDPIMNKSAGLSTKSKIVATVLQSNDRDTFTNLYPLLDLPEIVRACEILDAKRNITQLEKKISQMEKQRENTKKLTKKMDMCKLLLEDSFSFLSLTSSRANLVKGWVRSLSVEALEYRAIMFATALWKRLADLVHLNPTKDFSIDWFLPYCFGKDAPTDSILYAYKNLTFDNFEEAYSQYNFTYEMIRTKMGLASNSKQVESKSYNNKNRNNNKQAPLSKVNLVDIDRIKNIIINKEDIKTILWYYDEIVTPENINIIIDRLRKVDNNHIDLSYGKIVDIISKTKDERMLEHLYRFGNSKLNSYNINTESPVAVFGDASSSMEVAIKTSGIITSLLCYLTNASLDLFRTKNEHIENPPRTITDAVYFGKAMKATDMTSPASSLYYYYEKKLVIKTMIIVTDEEENTPATNEREEEKTTRFWEERYISKTFRLASGKTETPQKIEKYDFAHLYKKYTDEIYPAKLIFISFSDPNTDGRMATSLKEVIKEDYDALVTVFKFDVKNPDLNRMDVVLKFLST